MINIDTEMNDNNHNQDSNYNKHKPRVEIMDNAARVVKRMSRCIQETSNSQLCDSNNNANDQEHERQAIGDSHQFNENSKPSDCFTGEMNETEDWHLLEVDDQPSYAAGSNNKLSSKISNNGTNMSYKQMTSKSESSKDNKKYIDINPLGPQHRYSPKLIYLCTALYAVLPLASALTTFTLISLLVTKFYPITLLYLAYVFWDRQTCNRGGRRIDFVYRSKFWSYLAAYFPIKLRHTAEFKLDPSENYILTYHPHGIAAFGAVTAFATDGLKLSELFPGITARFMVHETSFVMPILKETFTLRGDCSVNSRSIDFLLSSKSKTGNLLTIVVGGLAEADLSDNDVLKIVIAERKGFVKKALIHGANIIPCIAFGENSVFKKVEFEPSSFLHRLKTKWYELFKFKHPIYYGRSLISEHWKGLMPYKKPITVVMGDPMRVERIENPSQEDIDSLHAYYLDHLRAIYEANEDLCEHSDKILELV